MATQSPDTIVLIQLVERRNAFGLDTDAKRAARLLFQPLRVAWALAATDAHAALPPGHD